MPELNKENELKRFVYISSSMVYGDFKKNSVMEVYTKRFLFMKKYLLTIILSLFISTIAIARSTGCKEGNCENGFGKWVYTDKTTYEGEWVGTKKNGQGVETWPNGYIYKGEFKNSEWSGVGVLTFPDGSTYEGEWAKGFMNGKGTFTWSDGTQKTGIWKNGKLQE